MYHQIKCRNENKGGQTLKFIVAPQYEGKESNLIELGKKLTKEHPDLGNQGKPSI